MPIIKPSKKFIGSEIDLRDAGKYIKPDVRQVAFNKRNNPNGAWLYFLPPYKLDVEGQGAWYRAFKIRDNFGEKFKEKYAVIPNDPVEHFERNLKVLFPDEHRIVEATDDNGQKRKQYPICGRVTTRVIYNVAYVNNLEAGAHILDLPSWNGASIINAWLAEKDTRGKERPVLNDPENCIPVFIKLKDGGGMPWQIEPSQGESATIPNELADSDALYDLDKVFIVKTPGELIAKLQAMYRPDIFEACMAGYPGYDRIVVDSGPVAAKRPVSSQQAASKQVAAIANIAKVEQESDPVTTEYVEDDVMDMSPPVAPVVSKVAKVTKEQAAEFINRPKPRVG